MKIKLNNGAELNPIIVMGEKRHIHGMNRDALAFVFPAETSLDELDALFSETNCEKITITDNAGDEYIHSAYTVRAELKRTPVEVEPATENEEAVYENRVIVSMAQRTYQESQLASLTETVDVLVMESLMN